jgi:hypothetical protein
MIKSGLQHPVRSKLSCGTPDGALHENPGPEFLKIEDPYFNILTTLSALPCTGRTIKIIRFLFPPIRQIYNVPRRLYDTDRFKGIEQYGPLLSHIKGLAQWMPVWPGNENRSWGFHLFRKTPDNRYSDG